MHSILAPSLGLLALAASSRALPRSASEGYSHSGSQCVDMKVPVTIDANNTIWDVPRVENDIDAVDFIWNVAERSAPSPASRIKGTRRVQLTVNVRVQLCVPDNGTKRNILHIASHGGNVGSAYWDSDYQPEDYSYVRAALAAGYSIMWYDRLGTGETDKPDAYDVVQFPAQVEILRQLTMLARAGKLVPEQQQQQQQKFDKVVLVGHSLGSLISAELTAARPELVDGAVLTGFLPNKYLGTVGSQHFGIVYAATAGEARFRDRPSGYLVSLSESNVQLNFFKKDAFDPAMLSYAASIKDTGTVAEVVSLPYAVATFKAPNFAGPVLMAVGEHDYVVCNGNCSGAADLDAIRKTYFPRAKNLTVQVHPGSGHALALHLNATAHYQSIFAYLQENSL